LDNQKLFLNFEDFKDRPAPAEWANADVKKIAMGALLHTIHDSYSSSHVLRENKGGRNAPSAGKIIAFLDYRSQDSSCHGEEDVEPDWLNNVEFKSNETPIHHSAWVIRRVNQQAKWEDAKIAEYLSTRVFALSDQAKAAFGGGYERCN